MCIFILINLNFIKQNKIYLFFFKIILYLNFKKISLFFEQNKESFYVELEKREIQRENEIETIEVENCIVSDSRMTPYMETLYRERREKLSVEINNISSFSDNDEVKINEENNLKKELEELNLLSKYQLKNQLANSNIKLKYNNFIDFQTTNIDILKLVKELRIISKKYKNSNFSSAKYNYNCI